MKMTGINKKNILKGTAAAFPYLSNAGRCALLVAKVSAGESNAKKEKNKFAELKQKIEIAANSVLFVAAIIALIIAFIQSLSCDD